MHEAIHKEMLDRCTADAAYFDPVSLAAAA